MFKFTFFSRDVGLLVYKLGIVSNSIFKLSFNLWNERGMNLANSFISTSLGTHHPWIPVRSKKDNCTYAAVARSTPPLSGANRVPLGSLNQTVNRTDAPAFRKSVFSRLNSDDLCRIFSPWERLSSPAKNTGFNSKSFRIRILDGNIATMSLLGFPLISYQQARNFALVASRISIRGPIARTGSDVRHALDWATF